MAYPKGAAHPKLVGDRSTAEILARLLVYFDNIWLPFGENQRYDLIIDDGDSFIRVQCKTGQLVKGAVIFNACSSNYHHPNRDGTVFYKQDYRGQADYFGVYCAAIDGVYLVPVKDVGIRKGYLRIAETKNRQAKRIRWAKDFELPKTLDLKKPAAGIPGKALTLLPQAPG